MSEIYAISDDVLTPPDTIFAQMDEILRSGVKIFQYRSKLNKKDESLIARLISLCEDYGAKFILNDDPALAKKLGAHGVHVGRGDGEISHLRKFLGHDMILGVTCYTDVARAQIAQKYGASYVAFGAMRASASKPDAPLCVPEIVQEAKRNLQIPLALIGGINAQNLNEILALKPGFVAMIGAIYKPLSISENLKNLQGIIDGFN